MCVRVSKSRFIVDVFCLKSAINGCVFFLHVSVFFFGDTKCDLMASIYM